MRETKKKRSHLGPGGLSKTPENVKVVPGEFLPDPYPEDKILFTITAKNADQYKDKLSLGLLKMFEMYPDTWKMNVYPTRRSAAFSDEMYQSTYEQCPDGRACRS